jgi:hypothetical protein
MLCGVSPSQASYFSCAAKKSNQKKAAPIPLFSALLAPFGGRQTGLPGPVWWMACVLYATLRANPRSVAVLVAKGG